VFVFGGGGGGGGGYFPVNVVQQMASILQKLRNVAQYIHII